MLRRPLAALATALSAAALVAVPAAGPATAAGTCTFTPPARIAIYQEVTTLPATITGACRPGGYGYWVMPGSDNEAGFDSYPVTAASIEVFDQPGRYGRQAWVPDGAGSDANCTGAACDDLTQNRPYSDIRLGGYASLTGVRSGGRITFTAGTGGWSQVSHQPIPRPRIGGEIQTQYADGRWHRVGKPFTTGANAKATVTVTIAAQRTYRFAMYSTANYFERASASVVR